MVSFFLSWTLGAQKQINPGVVHDVVIGPCIASLLLL